MNTNATELSALPPRKRLKAFRAIPDPTLRRQVAKALPWDLYSAILAESGLDNLKRNVRERMSLPDHSSSAG